MNGMLKGFAIHATCNKTRGARAHIVGQSLNLRGWLLLDLGYSHRAASWLCLLADDGLYAYRSGAGVTGACCDLPGYLHDHFGDCDALRPQTDCAANHLYRARCNQHGHWPGSYRLGQLEW